MHVRSLASAQRAENSAKLVEEVAYALEKKPVLCKKDAPGFIANRIQYAVLRECMEIVERGIADPEAVDALFKILYNALYR